MDIQSELYRKALNQTERLLASYEAGVITEQSFRVGIETIWACLGGIVELQDFQDLMTEANKELRALPAEVTAVAYHDENEGRLAVTVRSGTEVKIITAAGVRMSAKSFEFESKAAEHLRGVEKKVTSMAMTKVVA